MSDTAAALQSSKQFVRLIQGKRLSFIEEAALACRHYMPSFVLVFRKRPRAQVAGIVKTNVPSSGNNSRM